jgi:hypothetical protein
MKILNTLFYYEDGLLIRKITQGAARKGTEAGYMTADGYKRVCIQGKYYYVHKLVYLLHNPEFDMQGLVDHIDGNRANNLIENLRTADHTSNQYNKVRQKDGTSQYKGVWFDVKKGVWKAAIRYPGGRHYIGQFSEELEAAAAYDDLAIELHGEFAKLNIVR